MLRDLTRQRCIVVRDAAGYQISAKWMFRRGIVLESRIHFGKPSHKVRLERRGKERTNREVWLPQTALTPRSGKNEKLLKNYIHGYDDAN